MHKFPSYHQRDEKDCGPACLKIIFKYYEKNIPLNKLVELSETTRIGASLLGLCQAAEKLGLKTFAAKVSFEKLIEEVTLPCIVHWRQNHFVVVYKIGKKKVHLSDPAHGLITYSKEEFLRNWIGSSDANAEGVVLLLEPTAEFYEREEDDKESVLGFRFLFRYLKRYKKLISQLIFGLLAASIIQLAFPFFTQAIVDVGIQNQDLNFILLILLAQLMLFLGRISLEVIRRWILLHIGSRVKISLISDFFIKLMKLPISFFDRKVTGDIIQRIYDHRRVENFLTVTSLNVIFSLITFIVFGLVLLYYNFLVFTIFLVGSLIYVGWIMLFQRRRKDLDYKHFSQLSNEQTKVIELIQGMQEIKLHRAERQKRWSWEYIQARIFKIEIKNHSLEQYQTVGASFINELKNILITVLTAKLVIDGQLTLGMMLAVSYIIGQLNAPLLQLVEFMHSTQNAKISLERLSSIHQQKDEEATSEDKIKDIDVNSDIVVNNLSFRYPGSSDPVLKDLYFTLPANKVTAIVGPSGSGKTTLLKLLLKMYDPAKGEISIGTVNLKNVSVDLWRAVTGVVMQEGFIFNDTIASNITLGYDRIDKERLFRSLALSNAKEFVSDLPLGMNTKVGSDGVGLSTGQKQRILIARAIYKNPKYIFFDEATSALDANNEEMIINNLREFFKDRTAVVIAHRLSTVRNADQILVLDRHQIVERGNHESLITEKGVYYNLIKNQLELDRILQS